TSSGQRCPPSLPTVRCRHWTKQCVWVPSMVRRCVSAQERSWVWTPRGVRSRPARMSFPWLSAWRGLPSRSRPVTVISICETRGISRTWTRCDSLRQEKGPWSGSRGPFLCVCRSALVVSYYTVRRPTNTRRRSEEHTSELQSRFDLVCRLLLEKKNPSRNPFVFRVGF